QSLVDVTAGDDGAIDVEASTSLPATGGQNDQRAVSASVSATIGSVDLLNSLAPGIASVLAVSVARAPNYTVVATGIPGGAAVLGDDPIVNVSIAGQNVATLEAGDVEEETLVGLTLGDLIDGLDPLLAPLQPIVRLSIPVTKTVAPDGTSASVDAALLRIEILPPAAVGATEPLAEVLNQLLAALGLDLTQPLGFIELAPLSASVVAPVGGITCGGPTNNPVELQKVNSGPAIPGSSFDYTIAVGNVGTCTLTNVRVNDVLSGPAGTTILSTEPAGATITPAAPPALFNIAFPDVGPIAPNGRVTLRIRVQVPANATVGSRYTDFVTVAADCDGRTVTREFTLTEPAVEAPGSGPCAINGSTKSASHVEVFRGEQFAYFVNLYNSGGQPCTGTTITDALDPRVTFVSCSDGCTANGRTLTFNVGTLAPGQSITFRIIVQVNPDATGTLPNTARADTNETGPVDLTTPGPNITGRSILAPNDPAATPDRIRGLVRTGFDSMWGLAAALGLAALALRRVRREATAL
ncbi:MAG: DUF11 domain-containing protein, partial [Acidimicrobiia bacterium]|nr:DUF11 domain-containing protein [Acidimicrobiia bacterium]